MKLPTDLEAEKMLLGNALLVGTADPLGTLTEADFSGSNNRLITRAIRALEKEGAPIELAAVNSWFESNGLVVSPSHLASLLDGVPVSNNVDFYRRRVSETAVQRIIASRGYELWKAAAGGEPLDALENRLRQLTTTLSEKIHSAQSRDGVWAERNLPFQTAAELAAEAPVEVEWIAQPWVAAGSITELARISHHECEWGGG